MCDINVLFSKVNKSNDKLNLMQNFRINSSTNYKQTVVCKVWWGFFSYYKVSGFEKQLFLLLTLLRAFL